MNSESIYKGFEAAKNGTVIPVFQSGRTMESRYNPERDCDNICEGIKEGSFFVVCGIGSGIFIKKLSEKYTDAKIIAVEKSSADIDFLMQSENIKSLSKNDNIFFCSNEKLFEVLTSTYLPAKYGNLQIIEQRGWVNENQKEALELKAILQKTVSIISADYSVQSHFGKLWNSNILNNTKLAEKTELVSFSQITQNQLDKTAVVVAAGPTLDKTLNKIINSDNSNQFYIIATDTAAQVLVKQKIIPDVIISIDGQCVSYNHFVKTFTDEKNHTKDKPVFVFDLCANNSAVRHVYKKNNRLMFFCSGHPLAAAINSCCNSPLPKLFSGAGTVTISALDFALQAGFQKILILGADFAYTSGKAYTAGTYLDTLYNMTSSRITESEQTFSKLMYRTELKQVSPASKTTQILEAYKFSLEKYLSENNISFIKEDDVYKLENKNGKKQTNITIPPHTSNSGILSLKPFMEKFKNSNPKEAEMLLLPYIAWLRNNDRYKLLPYNDLLKLAFSRIVSYNI